MEYEVWHTATNEHVGMIDVPRHVDHAPGATVAIRIDGELEADGVKYNSIQMRVFRITRDPEEKEEKDKVFYWALETNLPFPLLKHLEGFTPKLVLPTPYETFRILH